MTDEARLPGLRLALREDLPALRALLADDALGATREDPDPAAAASYARAFEALEADPAHELLVVEEEGRVVALLQLSFLPNLTYAGGLRAQIEGVRVAAERRGTGLGKRFLRAAIERARARGAILVQLTTDRRRPEALGFYESLGFEGSHVGMKLRLDPGPSE